MNKIRVLIADDHPVFREGLCYFLTKEEDLDVIARAEDGAEAVALAKDLRPDVAILDIAMPKIDGIEAAKQIKSACPNTAILMLSAYGYDSYILAALRAGAAGYLLKNAPINDLIGAIRLAYAGEAVLDLKAVDKVLRYLAVEEGQEKRDIDVLHHREREVLKQAAMGKSNKAIGEEPFISERTVQTHMVNIFQKLRVGSRTEAVLRALKEGWITLDDLP
jgi:two-component system, NarL family, response regulator LiaR